MSKKRTIVDIARMLGTSHTTVSRALNDKPEISESTRKRIKKYAKKMGYTKNFFASSLRKGETKIVELLYYSSKDFLHEDPLLLVILENLQHELKIHGYKLMLNIKSNVELPQEELGLGEIADGVIIVNAHELSSKIACQLTPMQCVVLDNVIEGYSSINFDNTEFFDSIFQYFVSKRCKKVAILAIDYEAESIHSLRQRILSYKKVARKYKENLTDLGFIKVTGNDNSHLSTIKKIKPDAVICISLAESVLETIICHIEKSKQIVGDIQVVTINDYIRQSKPFYGIAHVSLDWAEIVHQTVLCLLSQLRSEKRAPIKKLVKSPFIEPGKEVGYTSKTASFSEAP